jgi:hypothetical protein
MNVRAHLGRFLARQAVATAAQAGGMGSPKAAAQRTAAADVHANLTSAARVHEAIVAIAGRARAASLDSGQSGTACSLRSGESLSRSQESWERLIKNQSLVTAACGPA